MKKKTLGILIKKYRKEKGLTQSELADQLHVSEKAVSSWECGRTCPDSDMMGEIRKVLGVSLDQLYDEGEEMEKREKPLPFGNVNRIAMVAILAVCIAAVVFVCIRLNSRVLDPAKESTTAPSNEASADATEVTDATKEQTTPVHLVVYSELSGYFGEQKSWFATLMKDKFNVTLEYRSSLNSDGETDLQKDAKNYDIAIWGSEDSMNMALEDGILYDLGDGVYAREGEAGLSENDYEEPYYNWYLRGDLYHQLNDPEIKNLEDFATVLRDMKALAGENYYGMAAFKTYGVDPALSSGYENEAALNPTASILISGYYGYVPMNIGYMGTDGTFYDALMTREDGSDGPYIEMLRYLNRLNREGLLLTEASYSTLQEQSDKILSSVGSYYLDTTSEAATSLVSCVPFDATPLVGRISPSHKYISISRYSENAKLCKQIIDWMYTAEGTLEMTYGPKDLCWEYKDIDQDGTMDCVFTDFGKKTIEDRLTVIQTDNPLYAEDNGEYFSDGCCQMNFTALSLRTINPMTGERIIYTEWKSNQEGSCEVVQAAKSYVLSSSEAAAFAIQQSCFTAERWVTLIEILSEGSWKAICAEDDEAFENILLQMTEEARAAGYDDVLSEYLKLVNADSSPVKNGGIVSIAP